MEFLTKYRVDLTSGKEIVAKNFTNWTSGNDIIDKFIQEKQLKFDGDDAVFEWIPYSELLEIKEIEDSCFATAIFKKGSLGYNNYEKEWSRYSFENVCLKYLHDSQDVTDEFIKKVFKFSMNLITIYLCNINFSYFDRLNHI
jgi:hypothetical protein